DYYCLLYMGSGISVF
nr:immunoglobulin light chain junction region [Macaca mulatta]MOY08546.1 immunoglobulin light chain junction region [Macaca mulatta]MOY08588.1 immunoglobulin light chain junction region [Macaca mulatta]